MPEDAPTPRAPTRTQARVQHAAPPNAPPNADPLAVQLDQAARRAAKDSAIADSALRHRAAPKLAGEVIADALKCPDCSYNLVGLRMGDRCPECGTPISFKGRARFGTSMIDAPRDYLQTLAWGARLLLLGAAMMMVAGLVAFVLIAVNTVMLRSPSGPVTPVALWTLWSSLCSITVVAVGGALWGWGTWIVTQPRRTGVQEGVDYQREWHKLRTTARWSQLAWAGGGVLSIIAHLIYLAAYNSANAAALAAWNNPANLNTPIGSMPSVVFVPTPFTSQALLVFSWVCWLGASFGVIALLWHLARLADWARDDRLDDRFSICSYTLGFGLGGGFLALILLRISGGSSRALDFLFVILLVGAILSTIYGCFQFIIAIIQFANMTTWANRNSQESHASDRRRNANITKRIADNMVKGANPLTTPNSPIVATHALHTQPNKPATPPPADAPAPDLGPTFDLADEPPQP